MNGASPRPPEREARARALRQLPLALAGVALFATSPMAGAALALVLAVAWPPGAPWRPLAPASVLLRYLPFAAAWYGFVWLYLHAAHAAGHPIPPQPDLEALATQGTGLPNFSVVVAVVVVLAPFVEELLFRGYLFGALVAAGLPMAAVQLVSAAAFGLVHGLDYALPIGALALLFGYLRQRHGALLPSMLAHAVHNGLTVVVTVAWPGHLEYLYPR